MLNRLRNYTFWRLDKIKGSKVTKAYKELEYYFNKDNDSVELKRYIEKKIKILLQNATNNTDYYKYLNGNNHLEDFPVINKKIINQQQERFLSSKYEQKKLFTMSTSGSTGTPFTSYQNVEKKRKVNAETIFFNGLAGYNVGYKFINLRSQNLKNKKSKIKQFIQNNSQVNIEKLDTTSVSEICAEIENITKKEKGTILSYASTLDAIANYFLNDKSSYIRKWKINGIISTSEILIDSTRDIIMDQFNTNCYSRYANMENGILGQDAPEHTNTFVLNECHYYFEILKMDSDEPASLGELGRIVVTDLYNYAMPMIRYDTGDVGTFQYQQINGINKKVIMNFGGRQIDMIYDTKGAFVSPHKLSVMFWGIENVEEFQFIQKDQKQYKVLLNVYNTFKHDKELIKILKGVLGNDAEIKIHQVKEIPKLKSGKSKYIMNEMSQN